VIKDVRNEQKVHVAAMCGHNKNRVVLNHGPHLQTNVHLEVICIYIY
jgi:hypothetical protein